MFRLCQHLLHPGKLVIRRVSAVKSEGLDCGIRALDAMNQPEQERRIQSAGKADAHRHIGPEAQANAFFQESQEFIGNRRSNPFSSTAFATSYHWRIESPRSSVHVKQPPGGRR